MKNISNHASLFLYNGELFPFESDYFNVVISSFVFYNIEPEKRLFTFKEIRRVLKTKGKFLILDFDEQKTIY